MPKQIYQLVESARDIMAFRAGESAMMLIPSLQSDLWHVIVEADGVGVIINCLLTEEGIYNAYGIEV